MRKISSLFLAVFLVSGFAQAQVSKQDFSRLSAVFAEEFNRELAPFNQKVIINKPPAPTMPDYWWDMDHAHASYSSFTEPDGYKEHYLFLFGGYARMEGMTLDGVMMTLCHEMGHGIGGAPYKNKTDGIPSSTEGQSDYYAARYCLKRMFDLVAPTQPVMAPNEYVASLCQNNFSTEQDISKCYRGFQVLEVERAYFLAHSGEETFYNRPDPKVVNEVDLSPIFYPSPQCRLDTMIAGLLNQERPACWYKEN